MSQGKDGREEETGMEGAERHTGEELPERWSARAKTGWQTIAAIASESAYSPKVAAGVRGTCRARRTPAGTPGPTGAKKSAKDERHWATGEMLGRLEKPRRTRLPSVPGRIKRRRRVEDV